MSRPFPGPKRTIVEETDDHVTINTGQCMFCGNDGFVTMPRKAYEAWNNGEGDFIQRAWPEGSAGDREQLINGTHDACFQKAFPDE